VDQMPARLPDGAHRVIKELTAAKMRAMMQGIVLEGTGKEAQLNGYSSGGKTGTANKIDPHTRTYSHTQLVASFAGFAPVSSPAISVTVVIDTPTVGSMYGSAVSAPVFREVAQQVLEYLGVPHDQPVRSQRQMNLAQNTVQPDDVPDQHIGDLAAMFDEVNSLPADDPIRQPENTAAMAANVQADRLAEQQVAASQPTNPHGGVGTLPDKLLAALRRNGEPNTRMQTTAGSEDVQMKAPVVPPQVVAQGNGAVMVDGGKRVSVPDFKGASLREVVEQSDRLGLRVQMLGSGLALEQAPASGTLVPLGTEIVVRFAR
jgi:cell division protein FtsI (penicillin-binding protein 3)